MEFEFVTDAGSVMQILKLWNIRLLESIPPSQPEFKTTPTITTKHSASKERRSFRTPKAAPLVPDNDLKRAGSFSKMHTLGTGQLVAGALPGRRSWGGSNEIYPPPVPSGSQLSQDSVFNSLTAPPPLPPRPEESDSDDPDYSYIDENKVKGPESQRGGRSRTLSSGMAGGRVGSPTLDDQLEELKKSIMRENKKKKRDMAATKGRKAATLHFPPRSSPRSRLPMNFVRAEPEDYLEPVASKRLTSTSSEGVPKRDKLSPNIDNFPRSLSDHTGNANNSSSSSIGTAPGEVFDDSQSPPDIHSHNGSTTNIGGGSITGAVGVVGPMGNPPALPPRPWRNSSVTSVSSVSSTTSPSNSSVAPLTTTNPNRPSISEETSIIEEEKNSLILGSPKESRQASNAEQNAAVAGGNNDQMGGSKDGSHSPIDMGSSSVSPPPPLPPRSPTRDRERLSRKSSSSSASSSTSSSHRCPRCRSLKKTKPTVGKTASLDPRGDIQGPVQNLTKEENRKSLPDLNNASPFPENNLAMNRHHHGYSVSREHNHGHSCSKCSVGSSTDGFHPSGTATTSNASLPASSSSQNFEYLQLVSEEGERRSQQQLQQTTDIDTDVSPALDLLSSCLQDLEYLENKVNQQSNNSPPNSGSPNQLNKSAAVLASEQRRMAVQTNIDAAMRQTELVQADLNMSRRSIRPVNSVGPEETRRMVANGHPPLLKKHNTVNSFGASIHSSSTSPSPPATFSGSNSSSNVPIHWTHQPHPPQSTGTGGRPANLANGSMSRNSSSSSLVSTPMNVASPLSIQSPNPVFSPVMNTAPSLNMGGAPPVPPRSLVSLGAETQQPLSSPHAVRGQPHPHHGHPMMGRSFSQTSNRPHTQSRGLSKSNSLGRHVGTWKTTIYGDPHHHAPQRTPSAGGMVGVGGPPSAAAFHNQNHVDSQTVFVHHLNRSSGRQHPRQMQAHLV